MADTTTDLVFEAEIEADRVEWHGDIDGLLGYEDGTFPRTVSGWLEAVHPDDIEPVKAAMGTALESGRFSASFRIRCCDGSYRDWEGRGRVFPRSVDSHVVIGSVTDVTEREAMTRSRRDAQRKLRELTTQLFTAHEDERRRLALEFHDGFGQQIAAVSIKLGSLRQDRGLAADTRRELARIQASVVELSNDLRRVSHQLHPAALEQLGLEAALRAPLLLVAHPGHLGQLRERELSDRSPARDRYLRVSRRTDGAGERRSSLRRPGWPWSGSLAWPVLKGRWAWSYASWTTVSASTSGRPGARVVWGW